MVFMVLTANIVCCQNWLPVDCGLNSVGYVLYPDSTTGKLFVGGSMSAIFPSCDHGDLITVWDGTMWDSTYELHGGGGDIRTIMRYQNQLYAGGNAGFASGHRIQGFTRWNGTLWDSLGVCQNPFNTMFPTQFCEFNNLLIVVGSFDSVSNNNSQVIAAWNGTSWIPMGLSAFYNDFQGWSCTVFNNELYMGGHIFDTTGVEHCFFKWNGTTWNEVDTNLKGTLLSLVIYNGELYLGGGVCYNNICYPILKYDGTNFSTVSNCSFGSIYTGFYRLKVIENKLFAVGNSIDSICGSPASDIVYYDGNTWYPFSSDRFSVNHGDQQATINDIAVYQNHLYVTGSFQWINNDSISDIAMYSSPLGIKELLDKKGAVEVYPSPTNTSINIHLYTYTTNETLLITDVLGEVIYKGTLSGIDNSIDVSRWSEGVYFITIISQDAIITQKFIKL